METTDPAVLASAPLPHPPVRNDWLALCREEILDPGLPIVDPHHHLVDRPNTGRYLLDELLADTGSGHNITHTVYLDSRPQIARGTACRNSDGTWIALS